jgi:hypothetical protein
MLNPARNRNSMKCTDDITETMSPMVLELEFTLLQFTYVENFKDDMSHVITTF